MAYTPAAAARRRCTATTKTGAPCRGWATWAPPVGRGWATWGGAPRLCARHARLAGLVVPSEGQAPRPPCRCAAYAWPHRPGGGLCRWPDPPQYRRTTEAGTHSLLWRPPGRASGALMRFLERTYRREARARARERTVRFPGFSDSA